MKKFFIVPFLVFGLFLAGCSGESVSQRDDVIRLGFVGPLTGDAASYGQLTRNTIADFLEENPVWGDKEVLFYPEDGKCNGQDAASAATKLTNVDQVHMIFSGGCSGEALGFVPVAEKAKVFSVSSLNTSPELTGFSKYFFRNAPSDALGGKKMAETVLAGNYKKVAMIVENSDFATAYADQFKLNFTSEVVVEENYNPGTTDFKSILQKVKVQGADVIVHLNQTPVAAGYVARQRFELGMKLPTFSTDATPGPEFFDVGKDATEGQTIVLTGIDTQNERVKESLAKYEAKYGPVDLDTYQILTVDLMNILKMAVEAVGTDGDKLHDYFVNMEAYDGMAGMTEFGEDGNSNLTPAVFVAKDGEFVLKR